MTNKCLRCNSHMHVKFDFGQEIKFCRTFRIYLTDKVVSCTEFNDSTPVKKVMEDWQLMEFVQSFKPYIIEFKEKVGFGPNEKEVLIRPAIDKDKRNICE